MGEPRNVHHPVSLFFTRSRDCTIIRVGFPVKPADALPQPVFLLQEPLQPLDGQGLHAGDHRVEAVHAVQHEGALGAGKLPSAIPRQLTPEGVRQQHLQVELGGGVEDPPPLVTAQLPSTDAAGLLHLDIEHSTGLQISITLFALTLKTPGSSL